MSIFLSLRGVPAVLPASRRGRCVRTLGILCLALGLAACSGAPAGVARVARVVDGDTAVLSGGREVRYIGIDTPETRRRTAAGLWQEVNEPFAAEAHRANEELVLGRPVRLEYDVERQDKYGRLLAYLWVEGAQAELMVQEELLRRGLALLYTFPPNVKHVDRLKSAQDEARREKRGLWSRDMVIPAPQAADYVGQRKMVRGAVRRVDATPDILGLVLDGLRVVIFTKDRDQFLKEGIHPERDYTGKDIRAFGLIKTYRGAVEMIVSHPWQIDVI